MAEWRQSLEKSSWKVVRDELVALHGGKISGDLVHMYRFYYRVAYRAARRKHKTADAMALVVTEACAGKGLAVHRCGDRSVWALGGEDHASLAALDVSLAKAAYPVMSDAELVARVLFESSYYGFPDSVHAKYPGMPTPPFARARIRISSHNPAAATGPSSAPLDDDRDRQPAYRLRALSQ